MDQTDCGKRYMCELAALPSEKLTNEEARTLAMIQAQQDGQPSVGRVLFQEAVRLGAATGDVTICKLRYQSCQVGRPLMREVVQDLQPRVSQHNFL